MINSCFDGGGDTYIIVTMLSMKLSGFHSRLSILLYLTEELTAKLLDISFLKNIGTRMYQQVIGIPMGLEPVPFRSSLFFCY